MFNAQSGEQTRHDGEFRPSRRWFAKAVAAGVALSAVPFTATASAWGSPSAFTIVTRPGVNVHVTGGHEFTLTVLGADRGVLERFDHVTGQNILALRSAHFSVRSIPVPG